MIKDVAAPEFFPKVERAQSKKTDSTSSSSEKSAKKAGGASSFMDELQNAKETTRSQDSREVKDDVRIESRPEVKSDSRVEKKFRAPQEPVEVSSNDRVRSAISTDQVSQKPIERLQTKSFDDGLSDDVNIEAFSHIDFENLSEEDLSAALELYRDQQAQIKQEAMLLFMGQMQAQVGVSPETVVQAFAKMDVQTLEGRPEDAEAQFFKNLNVSNDKKPIVTQLYRQMVSETGEAETNRKVAGGMQMKYEVLNSKDLRMKKLSQSIDELNQTFALRNQVLEGQVDKNGNIATKPEMKTQGQEKKEKGKAGLPIGGLGLAAGGAAAATSQASKSATFNAVTNASKAREVVASGTESIATPLSMKADHLSGLESVPSEQGLSQNSGGMGAESSGQDLQQNFQQNFAQSLNLPKEKLEASAASNGLKKYAAETSTSAKPSLTDVSSTPTVAGAQPQAPVAQAAPLAPSAMMMPGVRASDAERSENIQELIKQAQVIATKGGGEMKIEMKPEGMGTVNLKVAVQDGQVSVQMITENDQTKKMLENGLSDLKANLASHKLQVDTMRVDLSDPQRRLDSDQNSQDAQRENARQFASDFMGSFRDERQSFRQGLGEQTGWKSLGRDPGRPEMTPEKVEASANPYNRAKSSSRRLNLVA